MRLMGGDPNAADLDAGECHHAGKSFCSSSAHAAAASSSADSMTVGLAVEFAVGFAVGFAAESTVGLAVGGGGCTLSALGGPWPEFDLRMSFGFFFHNHNHWSPYAGS